MNVQFDDNNIPRNFGGGETPKMAAWLIKKGIAKDVAGANKIQMIAAVIFFAASIYFFVS